MKKHFITYLICLCSLELTAAKNDSIPMLLMDMNIQIESTEGINNMYNFDFTRADSQFRWLKKKYGWHPLPYFMLGLSQWWRMVPDVTNTGFDETFFAYMDSSLVASQNIFDKGSTVEGGFFLSATYAFIGRVHAERSNWTKAATAGKNALKYLDYCRGKGEYGAEILFGDALYNYYSVWIPENYPLLKPIMLFFKNGDKELGIKQLKEVANNAFFTRTEAQYFLMRILANEENNPMEALPVSQYLAQTFPNNPYFHRFYTRVLYATGRNQEAEREALSILNKLDSGYVGYESNNGRYASFFLGEIYRKRGLRGESKKYYTKAVEFGLDANAEKMGYHLYSLLNLGKIAFQEGDEKLAEEYFKNVKKLAKGKHPSHKLAVRYLKEMKKM
ncbi:tol-pal system protein YbgF [Reichenbachiella sp. MALMAid0571]|uniref:tetratricopeptide repeat protein n=1 Tax=Reichenbachiella sp. MALMAid0571 TaxID=3143939 RepID=UPI0032DF50C6